MTTMENEKNKLKQRIKELGLTQNYICQKLGISKSMLSHYLADRRNLNPDTERKLLQLIEQYDRLDIQ